MFGKDQKSNAAFLINAALLFGCVLLANLIKWTKEAYFVQFLIEKNLIFFLLTKESTVEIKAHC